jgi:hypothetical protein
MEFSDLQHLEAEILGLDTRVPRPVSSRGKISQLQHRIRAKRYLLHIREQDVDQCISQPQGSFGP